MTSIIMFIAGIILIIGTIASVIFSVFKTPINLRGFYGAFYTVISLAGFLGGIALTVISFFI